MNTREIEENLLSLCKKHRVSLVVVMLPHRHMDRSSAIKRAAVLRGLRLKGCSTAEIQQVCLMTKRGLRKVSREHSAANTQDRDTPTRTVRKRALVSPSDYRHYPPGYRVRKHGQSALKRHPLYGTWRGMLERCYDEFHPSYRWYGAKKVRVCSRWMNFFKFAEDVGPRPPGMWLIRVDPGGHYIPENCHWSASRGRRHKHKAR
jgi:hypothetical protein